MQIRSIFAGVSVFFVAVFIFSASENSAMAGLVISDNVGSTYDKWSEKAGEGKTLKIAGVHYYWKDGPHMDTKGGNDSA